MLLARSFRLEEAASASLAAEEDASALAVVDVEEALAAVDVEEEVVVAAAAVLSQIGKHTKLARLRRPKPAWTKARRGCLLLLGVRQEASGGQGHPRRQWTCGA